MATRRRAAPTPSASAPRVLVDFLFDRGTLHVVLENYGDVPLREVSVEFRPDPVDASGARLSSLALFRRLPFLAPRKRISAFLDSSASYLARGEPTLVTARIRCRDEAGARHTVEIAHDLGVYRDLAYLVPADERGTSDPPGQRPGQPQEGATHGSGAR
jgi:hypothetical protein